jgi:Flp pilus assembly protein TadD
MRAYNNRGLTKSRKGNLDGALADYNRAIELSPTTAGPYINRGILKKKLGDTKGSSADFSRAVQLNPAMEKFIKANGYSVTK